MDEKRQNLLVQALLERITTLELEIAQLRVELTVSGERAEGEGQ